MNETEHQHLLQFLQRLIGTSDQAVVVEQHTGHSRHNHTVSSSSSLVVVPGNSLVSTSGQQHNSSVNNSSSVPADTHHHQHQENSHLNPIPSSSSFINYLPFETQPHQYYNIVQHFNLTHDQLISKVASLMNQSFITSPDHSASTDRYSSTVHIIHDDHRGRDASFMANYQQLFNNNNNIGANLMSTSGSGAIPSTDAYEENEIQLSLWIKIIFYVVYVLICLLGIWGNVIVCYVVARKSTMHTVTNVFIANLALSDILLCLFAVPFTPLYLITFKRWIFGRVLCHLVPFAQGVSVYISAFTLMSIAIDRYFVILHPFKPRMLMRICLLIIVTIWISALILTFPYAHFMSYVNPRNYENSSFDENNMEPPFDKEEDIQMGDGGLETIYYCVEQWPHEKLSKMFAITTTALQFVIPFLIITFCYVKICAKLADRARTIPGNVSARREEQERERTRRTNGMLISMVIIFVISWLPLNMFNLIADFYEEATKWIYQRVLFLICHAIAMSSTCYNPFLYAWLNDNFRKEFKEVLPCFGRNKPSGNAGNGGTELTALVEMQQVNNSNNINVCVNMTGTITPVPGTSSSGGSSASATANTKPVKNTTTNDNQRKQHNSVKKTSNDDNKIKDNNSDNNGNRKFMRLCSKDGILGNFKFPGTSSTITVTSTIQNSTIVPLVDNNCPSSITVNANNNPANNHHKEARQSLISKDQVQIHYDGRMVSNIASTG